MQNTIASKAAVLVAALLVSGSALAGPSTHWRPRTNNFSRTHSAAELARFHAAPELGARGAGTGLALLLGAALIATGWRRRSTPE